MATNEERALEFRTSPMKHAKARKYDLLRVPGKGIGGLILLGHEFLWHELHYWRRRTIPHWPTNCEPCEHHCQVRERGYIAVCSKFKTTVMILEVTDNCGDVIKDLADARVTLRGCVVNMSRLEKRDNGKLTMHPEGNQVDSSLIPEAPDVAEVLRRIWGLGRQGPMVPLERTLDLEKLRCRVKSSVTNGLAD